MNDQPAQDYSQYPPQPPASVLPADQPQNAPESGSDSATPSEKLEDQNVFFMLGVTDGSNDQREEFLDELQQVIWEDFLEYDVKLLMTTEEYEELQRLLSEQAGQPLAQQETAVEYIEKLVPELENIMLEKALELKADLLRERITGMKEYFSGQQEAAEKISRAEELIVQERWYSAAALLNSIS